MQILTWPEPDVPMALRAQVAALHDQAWPGEEPSGAGPTHDPALHPVSLLLVDDGRVVAALDILSKDLAHADQIYAASGLSTVVTDVRLRGRGHGSVLVRAAREAIAASGADLALFTCDTPLARFYVGCGFAVLEGTIVVGGTPDDPFPSDQFDKVTLAAFFSARAMDARAAFTGARIALYPGPIDRLW